MCIRDRTGADVGGEARRLTFPDDAGVFEHIDAVGVRQREGDVLLAQQHGDRLSLIHIWGGQVRVWETPEGTAVELDGAYPLALPLRRLLVRLAEVYPLPHVPRIKRPDPPPPLAWAGDRLALFGSAYPTKILMRLAGRGWTFEAVCCESHSKDCLLYTSRCV